MHTRSVPHPKSVLTNLVSPPSRQEPNSTPSDTGVVIEAHLPDFAELAAAHVQRDLATTVWMYFNVLYFYHWSDVNSLHL